MQAVQEEFVDLLEERRKDCDVMWVSRITRPLAPYQLSADNVYTRKQAIEAVLADPRILEVIQDVAAARSVPESMILAESQDMLQEMASKAHLPTVRWLGEYICIYVFGLEKLRIFQHVL